MRSSVVAHLPIWPKQDPSFSHCPEKHSLSSFICSLNTESKNAGSSPAPGLGSKNSDGLGL